MWAHSLKQSFKVVVALILAYMVFIFTHFALTTPLLFRNQTQQKARHDIAGIYADFEESMNESKRIPRLRHIPRPPGARVQRAQESRINDIPLEACALETRMPAEKVLDFYFNYFSPRGWQDITRESMKMRLNPVEYQDWNAMQNDSYVDKYQTTMKNSLVMKGPKASIHITMTQVGRPEKNLVSIRWFGTPEMSELIPTRFVGKNHGEEPAMVLEDPLQNGENRTSQFYRSRAEPQAYFDRLSKRFMREGYDIQFENVQATESTEEQPIFAYFTHPKKGRFMLVVTRDSGDKTYSAGLFLKM
ncbi:MAG: hypothetical protein ACI9TH_000943 [Kiritimatiellia bacterium]|jgi:hypothetical protein